jgi:UV DNA damage repair endonuclease
MDQSREVLETRGTYNRSWSRNPLLVLCEFGGIALIFWADVHHHIYLSKTLYLFHSRGSHFGCAVCGGLILV